MPTPLYAINDRVQFVAPFVNNVVYTVTRIQYLTENNEASEVPTDNWQYELAEGITNSVEVYLEAAP
jgi:hypothetical protein